MRKLTLTLAAASLATLAIGTLQAQGGPPGVADASRVTAGTYKVDAAHSMVGWEVSHFGFNDYFGIFGDVAGEITLDPANPSASKVDVTIPIASVMVPSAGLKDHLLRAGRDGAAADFFGPNPAAARFVSTSVQPTGPTEANITGNLTMNGQTKPITIEAELAGAGNNPMSRVATVGFHGEAKLKRSDWGVGFGIPFGLADEVELNITIAGEKQ
jgi:polyisoprenoid-binding protein YceI